MLTRFEDNTDYARTSTDIIFTCILRETVMYVTVNMVGAKHCCGVVLMLGHCRQWRHQFRVSWSLPRLRLFP